MDHLHRRFSWTRRMGRGLALAAAIGGPALAQGTATAPCTVRIRPRAAADYDLATEVTLRGVVAGWKDGHILLRIPAGTLRVDTGAWDAAGALEPGATIEVLASRREEAGRQRFLAREIRHGGGVLAIRDAQGVPNPQDPVSYTPPSR